MSKKYFYSRRLCAVLALAIGATTVQTAPTAWAQLQSGRLLIRSCSATNYPSVTCAVVPINATGNPISGIPAEAFEVADGATPVKDLSVSEALNPETSTSTLWVVDMSGNLGNKYVLDVRDAVESSMKDKPLKELVGLIVLTGKIENPSNAENIPLDLARESAFSKDANDAINNKVRKLSATPSAPLHDGISKAILMVRKQPIGTRAIVVLTDGFDTRSTPANITSIIDSAKAEGIPIYTYLIGSARPDDLKRLAVSTDGAFFAATNAATVAKSYRDLQNRLKTQYAVTFTVTNPDKAERKFSFRLNLPDKKIEPAEYLVRPQKPVVPVIETVTFRSGDKAADPTQLPADNVIVELAVNAQTVSRVEYQVDDGDSVVKNQAPTYSYTLRASGLEPGSAHTLLIKVYGAEGSKDVTEQKVAFTMGGSGGAAGTGNPTVPSAATAAPAQTPIPEPTTAPANGLDGIINEFSSNRLMQVALGIGLLALLVLLGLIISSVLRRRKGTLAPVTDVITSPFAPTGGFPSMVNTGFNANPVSQVSQGLGRPNDDPTQVFIDKGTESQPTQVLQSARAMLEVLSGPTQGDRIPLGVPGKTLIIIGRDADPLVGDLQLKSTFVSRKHAEIHLEGDDMFLVDLGSSSGTKLNGQKLSPKAKQKFEVGAEISFADVKTKVSKPD